MTSEDEGDKFRPYLRVTFGIIPCSPPQRRSVHCLRHHWTRGDDHFTRLVCQFCGEVRYIVDNDWAEVEGSPILVVPTKIKLASRDHRKVFAKDPLRWLK